MMGNEADGTSDHVERLRGQWAKEAPDIDTSPMTILGRAYRLSNLVRPSIEDTFARFGLDRGEFDVISTLRRSGPPYELTPTELYRLLMISSGGLSHRLVRLEKSGLITREKSTGDGRSFLVALTPEGQRRAEEAFRADMANELRFIEVMSKEKRSALAELLRDLSIEVEALDGAGEAL